MKGSKHSSVHEIAKCGVDGARKARKAGGGVNEAAEDLKMKPMRYNESRVEDEAEERKRGGRIKRKMVGAVHGKAAKHHAGRKPRKSGGRASSDMSPFTSARHGTPAKGRSLEPETMG